MAQMAQVLENPDPDRYVGGYRKSLREKEVRGNLQSVFNEITQRNIHKEVLSESAKSRTEGEHTEKDALKRLLMHIVSEVDELQRNIEEFQGRCFTKKYQVLEGECGKLLLDLDSLDIAGRSEIRQERKQTIIRVEELGRALAAKTHKSGEPCNDCYIKNPKLNFQREKLP